MINTKELPRTTLVRGDRVSQVKMEPGLLRPPLVLPRMVVCNVGTTFSRVAHRSSRPPSVLIARAFGTWLSQGLADLLVPRGYRCEFVSSGRELLDRAQSGWPDVIVLDADLPDLDTAQVCRRLRQHQAAWNTPVLVVTPARATKQERLAALEAGAWDCLSLVLEPEELTVKLDAMARLKLEMDRTLEDSAVDPASGLYTTRGLERRARELAAEAARRHAPLACVALGVEPDPKTTAYAAHLLQASGRASDSIGSLSPGEFAVLAPGAAPDGAVKLAKRLSLLMETAAPRPAGTPPLHVHAGYEAVADMHETPIDPASLLAHAGLALRQARAVNIGAGEGDRIRGYRA
jgi:DNA-binding response OmpR family regulator